MSIRLHISSDKTRELGLEVKRYGDRGVEFVEVREIDFVRADLHGPSFGWCKDLRGSLLEAQPPSDDLPLSRISVHDVFPGTPRRPRGIFQLRTATAELEVEEHPNDLDPPTVKHRIEMFAEGGKPSEMFADLKALWLAIKTGELEGVSITHSYETELPLG